MADRHLVQMRQVAKQLQVVEVEIVARIDSHPERRRQRRRLGITCERPLRRVASLFKGARERLGIQLDPVGAERPGKRDRLRFGIDEQAYPNAGATQGRHGRFERSGLRTGHPARLAGDLSGGDRDQRALMRMHLVNDGQQVGARIAFDVVFHGGMGRERRGDVADILRRDVPGIETWVHGDAGSARGEAHVDRVEDARKPPATRIAQRGHLVDVDGESGNSQPRLGTGGGRLVTDSLRHRSPQLLLHDVDDFLRPRGDLVDVLAFEHDT
jgi:hypothetical protein